MEGLGSRRRVTFAFVLLWLGLAGIARAGIPERLKWVRGIVTSVNRYAGDPNGHDPRRRGDSRDGVSKAR